MDSIQLPEVRGRLVDGRLTCTTDVRFGNRGDYRTCQAPATYRVWDFVSGVCWVGDFCARHRRYEHEEHSPYQKIRAGVVQPTVQGVPDC